MNRRSFLGKLAGLAVAAVVGATEVPEVEPIRDHAMCTWTYDGPQGRSVVTDLELAIRRVKDDHRLRPDEHIYSRTEFEEMNRIRDQTVLAREMELAKGLGGSAQWQPIKEAR